MWPQDARPRQIRRGHQQHPLQFLEARQVAVDPFDDFFVERLHLGMCDQFRPRTERNVIFFRPAFQRYKVGRHKDCRELAPVAQDGGDITFQGYKEGVVYLNMKGSCAGCPSSTATLQHGIQNLLKHFVPDVVEVRPM